MINKFFFIFFSIFSLIKSESEALDEIKLQISKRDINFKNIFRQKLEKEKEKVFNDIKVFEKKCEMAVLNCQTIHKKCDKESHVSKVFEDFMFNEIHNQEEFDESETSCYFAKLYFGEYLRIIDENINSLRMTVDNMKLLLNKTNDEKNANMILLQKEIIQNEINRQMNNEPLFAQIMHSMGNMFNEDNYRNVMIEVSSALSQESDEKESHYENIEEKIKSIPDIKDKSIAIRQGIITFNEIISNFKKAKENIKEISEAKISQCESLANDETKSESSSVKVKMENKDIVALKKFIREEVHKKENKKNKICFLKEKYLELCSSLEGFCQKQKDEMNYAIFTINELELFLE